MSAFGFGDGISVDYFIGDPKFLGMGLGAAVLRAFAADISAQLPERDRILYVLHSDANIKASTCARSAGFRVAKHITDWGSPSTIFSCAV